MTEISLPYDQVCEIIQDVAADWACDPEELIAMTKKFTLNEWMALFSRFGHTLWRALEEAHLAKLDQTGESS